MMVTTKNRGIFLRTKVGSWIDLHERHLCSKLFRRPEQPMLLLFACEEIERHKDDEKDVVAEGYDREKESLLS